MLHPSVADLIIKNFHDLGDDGLIADKNVSFIHPVHEPVDSLADFFSFENDLILFGYCIYRIVSRFVFPQCLSGVINGMCNMQIRFLGNGMPIQQESTRRVCCDGDHNNSKSFHLLADFWGKCDAAWG